MKVKLILIAAVLFSATFFIISTRFEVLDPGKVMVVANEAGSPMVLLSDGSYFVRDWNIVSGCYQLTRIGIIDFNFAISAPMDKCQ